MNPPFVFLRVFLKDQLIGIKQFAQDQIVIGTHQEVSLELEDPSVAPFHSIIVKKDANNYRIIDLGSQNGTFKNGEKILEAPLVSQDQLEIGAYRIEFFVGAVSMTQSTTQPSPPPLQTQSASQDLQNLSSSSRLKPQTSTDVQAPSIEPEFKSAERDEADEAEEAKANLVRAKNFPSQEEESEKISAAIIKPVRMSPKTFAPPNAFKSLKEVIKPGRGTVVEVIVAWKERILKTHHFHKKSSITIGQGEGADVQIPLLNMQKDKHRLIKIGSLATVYFTPEMTGDYYTSENNSVTPFSELIQSDRVQKSFNGHRIKMHQGEMLRIGLQNNLISIYIRYIQEIPPPNSMSFFPFSASEMAGLVLAAVLAVAFSFYIGSAPLKEPENKPPEIKAVIKWQPKEKKIEMKKREKKVVTKLPIAKPPEVKKSFKPRKKKLVSKLLKKKKKVRRPQPKKQTKVAVVKKAIPPKASPPKEVKKKDPSQLGLLSVLGSKGTQSKLSQIYSGSGTVNEAIKSQSTRSSNAPKTSSLFKTGLKSAKAGKKTAFNTVGIGKVGVQESRKVVYESSSSLHSKRRTSFVDFKGQKATFSGSIDREGIRRVIRDNRGLIRACYNEALNRNESLSGKLVLHWDIEEDGRVSKAGVVTNGLGDEEMASCVLNRLRLWNFPPPPRGQIGRITGYPFVFMAK